MKLTKTNIAGIEVPPGKTETIVFDDDVSGFGLRVRAGGSRNWIFQYRLGGKQRRISFGSATTLSAQQAREKAATLDAQVKLGHDPAGQKIEARARAAETLGQVLQPYLLHKKASLRPRTYVEAERHLLTNAKRLHGLQVASIDRRTIATLLAEIAANNGATAANRVRADLSAFFSWAMREGIAGNNRVVGTNKAVESGARDRVLSDVELAAIWNALGDDDYSDIMRLLALSGQRRTEIGGLRWQEIDLDKAMISLPAQRTKNHKPHDIPLSPAALAILKERANNRRGDYVFGRGEGGYQDWSKSKNALDQRLGNAVANWRLHDFRRTLSTGMHDELGIAPHIVEAVLNHVSGHRAGVAGTYNRALYSKEKAIALARWAEHLTAITAITGGASGKIVTIRARRDKR
jgi:integrase